MKITLDFGRKVVTLEGTKDETAALLNKVQELAPDMTEVRLILDGAGGQGEPPPPPAGGGLQPRPATTTLRDFAKKLAPDPQVERIAVIGYYVTKYQNKDSFSPAEVADWMALCGWPKPDVPARALFDAKSRRGYVESKGRGKWAITTEAENFVLSLLESKGMNG